jgi:hypothetical protein
VLLEVLGGGGHELDGDKLVASPLEALDDLADEATLCIALESRACFCVSVSKQTYLDAIRLDSDEAISTTSTHVPTLTAHHNHWD